MVYRVLNPASYAAYPECLNQIIVTNFISCNQCSILNTSNFNITKFPVPGLSSHFRNGVDNTSALAKVISAISQSLIFILSSRILKT